MALDKEMEIAIQEAAVELGLKEVTARRLQKWLKDMSEREISATEERQHLDTLKSSLTAPTGE